MGDNSKNPTIQKMTRARYIISEPPRMMRNISKYYTAKNVQNRQVLKFDTRKPDPIRQLWNRCGERENSEHADQECIIETLDQIQEREKQAHGRNTKKDDAQRNTGRQLHQKTNKLKDNGKNIGQERKGHHGKK